MPTTDVLKVQGDYIIKTQTSGSIRLDTGSSTGTVTITGNLDVQGTTTTIESTIATIKDNTVVLNSGQGALGQVSAGNGTAGLLIDRGQAADLDYAASFLYNDRRTWSGGSASLTGVFEFGVGGGQGVGRLATAISAGALVYDPKAPTDSGRQAIYFIGKGATNAVLTLSGIQYDYASYVGQDNDIPNVKWVKAEIAREAATPPNIRRLQQLNSALTLTDNGLDAPTLALNLGGPLQRFIWRSNGEYTMLGTQGRLSFIDNSITALGTTSTNAPLFLSASGNGAIHLTGYTVIEPSGFSPTTLAVVKDNLPVGATAIYTTSTVSVTGGGTNLFFVNNNNKSDGNGGLQPEELVSRRKALVYAIVF
jgi:hypothetical protein